MGGVEHTFAVTTTTGITPAALAPNLTAGVWVAVVSSPTPMGGAQTALTIAISTASFTGEVTAVTPAAVGVPGSLTLKDSGGVSTDFILAEETSVLPATWADKLVVGDLVTVVSSLSKLSNKQTALTVTINTVQYKGTVTAYTAATASTPGSITIQAGTVSTVFTTIMATAILPAGSTPAVGNLVLVVPDLVTVTTPLTATSINILPPTGRIPVVIPPQQAAVLLLLRIGDQSVLNVFQRSKDDLLIRQRSLILNRSLGTNTGANPAGVAARARFARAQTVTL